MTEKKPRVNTGRRAGEAEQTRPFYENDRPDLPKINIQDGFIEKQVTLVTATRMKMTDKGVFIPREMIKYFGKILKPTDVFVWIFIYINEKPNSGVKMSFRKMAKSMGLSLNTVRNSVEKMVAVGILDVVRNQNTGQPNRYKTVDKV